MGEIQEIFRKGCLIDLDVGVWTAERKLQPEDLGLTKEEVPENFSLGHKKLIPHAASAKPRRLESQARLAVRKFSFPFPFGGARYVPRVRLLECTTTLDTIIQQFNDVADEIVASYGKHRLDIRADFTRAAHEAYNRRILLCGGLDTPEDQYVQDFLARIDKVYPSPDKLRRKYHMSYVVYQVELPDLTRATYADIVDDAAKMELMREAFTEGVRQKVDSFAEGVVLQMRGEAQGVLRRAVKTLKQGVRPTKYTVDMVRKMIERYGTMDLVGDELFMGRLLDFKIRVLDVYQDADIVNDKVLRGNVVTEMEALLEMATDKEAIRMLVDRYRMELVGA